ncbi:four-helix bundle copper-binding protein [Chitinolyticbacter albus]|uniref:four-helix bundle copper-binding protein n=1 Tax=Chitinolyticbacter albus TaxID=2961951 RepID=UPI0035712C62
MRGATHATSRNTACIEACHACNIACEHCVASCLAEGHASERAVCIRLDRDCADVCHPSVTLMARGSAYAPALCAICAQLCEACAAEYAWHDAEHCLAPLPAASAQWRVA